MRPSLSNLLGRPPRRRRPAAAKAALAIESLDARLTPSATAFFDAARQALAVVGTDAGEQITLSRTAAGAILLDGKPTGATVATTGTINVVAGGGADAVVLDFRAGLFAGPNGEAKIHIDGGASASDSLTVRGTQGADVIDLGLDDGRPVINLNGDQDAEIVVAGTEGFNVYGHGGGDTLNAAGSGVVGSPLVTEVSLFAGPGNDTLRAGNGATTFVGGAGNDFMVGGPAADRYVFSGGYLGADTVSDTPGQANKLVFGGLADLGLSDFVGAVHLNLGKASAQVVNSGDLTLTVSGVDHVVGSKYNDVIKGNDRDNVIEGLGGNDSLSGAGGTDRLHGGTGGDELRGDGNQDFLYGDSGADDLFGGTGDDELHGSTGGDYLGGNDGNDLLYGEAGADYLAGHNNEDSLYGGGGDDFLDGGANNDRLFGEADQDRLVGSAGDDKLFGGDGVDKLYGSAGSDYLTGGADYDQLHGGDDTDTLHFGGLDDVAADSADGDRGGDIFAIRLLSDLILTDYNPFEGDAFTFIP